MSIENKQEFQEFVQEVVEGLPEALSTATEAQVEAKNFSAETGKFDRVLSAKFDDLNKSYGRVAETLTEIASHLATKGEGKDAAKR